EIPLSELSSDVFSSFLLFCEMGIIDSCACLDEFGLICRFISLWILLKMFLFFYVVWLTWSDVK
ncbi:hypothetical protein, partial [Klebsiella pneumoniae]|uniref:hypothetical protein n=1 Tax=Klebsiella pneumoniae TaxID=573 RepID=UPI002730DE7C